MYLPRLGIRAPAVTRPYMPKSKKRNHFKRRSRRRDSQRSGLGFVAMRHPMARIPKETLIEATRKIANSSRVDFPEQLAKVETLLGSLAPLDVVARLAFYGLYRSVGEPNESPSPDSETELLPVHVELAQALCLKRPLELEYPPPTYESSGVVAELIPALNKLTELFHLRRLNSAPEEATDADSGIWMVQERLRLNTQFVRNWSNFTRVVNITRRLCAPIDAEFEGQGLLPASKLIALFEHILRRTERKVTEWSTVLHAIIDLESSDDIVKTYGEIDSRFQDYLRGELERYNRSHLSRGEARVLVFCHYESHLSECYTWTAKEIASEIGFDQQIVSASLDRLSLKFSELSDSNGEHFFLGNPIWTKPVISLMNSEYFCAQPQLFFTFIFPILTELLSGNESALRAYQMRRAAFLEAEIENLFTKNFLFAKTASNYRWGSYENDLLVKLDSYLVIVEAKSGSVSWEALRGAPDRAKKHVQELVLAPSLQSLRLSEQIHAALADPEKKDSLLPAFPLPLEGVCDVLRISVTLEDFATLQSQHDLLSDAGWIPSDHPISPCFLLADLEIVFEILEQSFLKIHYLHRRVEKQFDLRYRGDEIDLLGFYLRTGFNVGAPEGKNVILQLHMSQDIDLYYSSMDENIDRRKPKPRIADWWNHICSHLETICPKNWTQMTTALLDIPVQDQRNIRIKFKRICKNIRKNWHISNHNCAVFYSNTHTDTAIIFCAIVEKLWNERMHRYENLVSHAFVNSQIRRCLLIAVNIDRNEYPYSTIALYIRPLEIGLSSNRVSAND